MNRRNFICGATGALAAMSWPGLRAVFANEALAAGRRVRVGIIGTGTRGTELGRVLLKYFPADVPAICDLSDAHAQAAAEIFGSLGGVRPQVYSGDPHSYRQLLERGDLDAVMINTPIEWHVPMSVEAMQAGLEVGCEVTAGHHLEELWELVRAKERTGRRYMLLENYVYTPVNMMVLNMCGLGLWGKPYYAECSYIHDCRDLRFNADGTLTWRGRAVRDEFGNDYPTHALGPVSKWMGLGDGDRMERLTCMMTRPQVMHEYAVKKFGEHSEPAKVDFKLGEMVSTLIQTVQGRVIRVDLDVHSPRPISHYYLLQGSQGCFDTRTGVYIEGRTPREIWESIDTYMEQYRHPWWERWGEQAKDTGHYGSDYFVIYDFVRMLQTGREPWLDVYDAASWSVLYDCTHRSLEQGSAPVELPDFTGGRWKDKDWRKDGLKPVLDS